jgi:hypothetical protein
MADAEIKKKEQEQAAAAATALKLEPIPTPQSGALPSAPSVIPPLSKYESIMENGKAYRTEFIQMWRDISLAVSATAGNARSIQQNGTKLLSALLRATTQAGPTRPQIVTWLCGFCGSKIVQQATSGNKLLVWSFAYLSRLVAEKFPDVIRVGVVGEMTKSGSFTIGGTPDILVSINPKDSPKAFEVYTRFWIALMIVSNDESALWAWVSSVAMALLNRKQFISSIEAMWNMMKLYVFMDIGLHDFRRIFGTQATSLIQSIETNVFPAIDRELQAFSQSTNTSIQLRFYLDACYNIIQSRAYQNNPEGQVLSAAVESELNPEL